MKSVIAVEHAICGVLRARHVWELGFADSAGSSAGSFPWVLNLQPQPLSIETTDAKEGATLEVLEGLKSLYANTDMDSICCRVQDGEP